MLSYLIRQSRRLLVAAALASVISGVCSVLLLVQVNTALTAEAGERAALAWLFAAVAVLTMVARMFAAVLFERLSQHVHAELRTYISARVVDTDYRKLELLGGARVQSALAEHSARVAEFFVSVPSLIINGIVVLGCLAYMAWLSWLVFCVAVLVIGLGGLGYHLAHLRAIGHLDAAAREQDRLFDYFRALVDGAKELRLHRDKRAVFSEAVLGGSIDAVRRERTLGASIFAVSASWGNFLVYAFIGLVLFVLVGDTPERARIMTGFALMFLYMVTPLENLLLNVPRLNLARVSARRIDAIAEDLPPAPPEASAPPAPLRRLALEDVRHSYYHEVLDDIFTLGPVRLDFAPGQITFLVGGNGSGKTTLAKLLVGLYAPEQGRIVVNGEAVNEAGRDRYRQHFSAIFSDFYLFDSLLGDASAARDARANALLTKLHLQHKVQVRQGAFTTRALSQGQRKRLALVVAYLEDRPFLVFDEWAADQDPVFKDVFYREVLPELRAQGKAVLVISHDDRYFPLADRLVRLENGQVVAVEERRAPSAQSGRALEADPA